MKGKGQELGSGSPWQASLPIGQQAQVLCGTPGPRGQLLPTLQARGRLPGLPPTLGRSEPGQSRAPGAGFWSETSSAKSLLFSGDQTHLAPYFPNRPSPLSVLLPPSPGPLPGRGLHALQDRPQQLMAAGPGSWLPGSENLHGKRCLCLTLKDRKIKQ